MPGIILTLMAMLACTLHSQVIHPRNHESSLWAGAEILKESIEREGDTEKYRRVIRIKGFSNLILRTTELKLLDEKKRKPLKDEAWIADHVLAIPRANADQKAIAALLEKLHLKVRTLPLSGILVIDCPSELDGVQKTIAALSGSQSLFEVVEPDAIIVGKLEPDDDYFGDQWALNSTTSDGDINAPEAWGIQHDAQNVLVGILDSGIDLGHSDLQANIWTNPGEIVNNVDDDNNGLINDYHGWNFSGGSNNCGDDFGHGTKVAGICGAKGNNSMGVSGVCWSVKMVAVKVLNSAGNFGSCSHAVEGLYYCCGIGCRIASNSWVLYGNSSYACLSRAIEATRVAGMLVVAAADDVKTNHDDDPVYPACFPHENVIAVTGTMDSGELDPAWGFGKSSIDLGAPGVRIYTTLRGGGWGHCSGTSCAVPHVTGTCALMWARWPMKDYTWIKSKLISSVTPRMSLKKKCVSGGSLNAWKALQ